MCIGLKPEMHLKDDVRPLIPVAAEIQVDLQNRPEDQVLARQNTSGHKKRRAQSSRLRLGAADQPEDQNLLGNYIAHKIFLHWTSNAVAPETLVGWQHQIRGSMCPFNICK